MDEAAESLLIKPAKAVNPKVKMVIKFPNWYEHFAGSGLRPGQGAAALRRHLHRHRNARSRGHGPEPPVLRELRDHPLLREHRAGPQRRRLGGHRQPAIFGPLRRAIGEHGVRQGAGDDALRVGRREPRPARAGARTNWQDQPTSFDFNRLQQSAQAAEGTNAVLTWGRVAGDALVKADAFLGKLGKPIGIASYRPPHAWAEDFLHNYFGMIGIPIELYPTFPTNANLVLLTEAAAFDPGHRRQDQRPVGRRQIGRHHLGPAPRAARQGHRRHRRVAVHRPENPRRTNIKAVTAPATRPASATEQAGDILFPDIRFLTNDAWQLVRALANGRGLPAAAHGPLFAGRPLRLDDSRKLQRPLPIAAERYDRDQELRDGRLSGAAGRPQPGRAVCL